MSATDNHVFKIPLLMCKTNTKMITKVSTERDFVSESIENVVNFEDSEVNTYKNLDDENDLEKSSTETEHEKKVIDTETEVKEITVPKEEENRSEHFQPSKKQTSLCSIPYTEPSWGGLSDVLYSLEEMKMGVSLRTIPLDNRSFYCFGRLDNCHITMAHPTISRYHAVLQFRSTFSATDEKKGFYIFDMGSTHGTFLNKERIAPKTYIKVQVGHMIKLGGSTRVFLLHGPENDKEQESDYTYSQLLEIRRKQLDDREKAYLEDQAKLGQKSESEGIDWGMGEDANEESDLSENPYAATNNEELYLEDPKKTLKGWFDREGEELVYNVEEKGFRQFHCHIDLPIENVTGNLVTAEATVSGKKKEAAFQCALEACRILDRYGLLRQSSHESKKRKKKNWEEDDFYDSDEDNFFDRTGDLEIKRKQRMLQTNKNKSTVDTYESLVEKHEKIVKEIEEVECRLQRMIAVTNRNDTQMNSERDSVDDYLFNLESQQPLDKLELRKCRSQLTTLEKEKERLSKLMKIAKPFFLPPIKTNNEVNVKPSINEVKSTEEEGQKVSGNVNIKLHSKPQISDTNILNPESSSQKIDVVNAPVKKEESTSDIKKQETHVEKKLNQSVQPKKTKSSQRRENIRDRNTDGDYFSNIIWTPPSGQTGDGRTSLNDKLGY